MDGTRRVAKVFAVLLIGLAMLFLGLYLGWLQWDDGDVKPPKGTTVTVERTVEVPGPERTNEVTVEKTVEKTVKEPCEETLPDTGPSLR
jgi:hypothetical protein